MAVFYIQNSILCPLTLYPLKKSVRKGQNLSDGIREISADMGVNPPFK